jgi:hypothetical protein
MGGSEHSQNEFPHTNIDMNANDQSKQGPEAEIGTENPIGPESKDTDGGNVGTDVISPQEGASDDKSDEPLVLPSNPPPNKAVMGGSEHSRNEFPHKNIDMNANDQSKQGLETEIGTENPNEPESEGTDCGNVGTDIISPQFGASDYKSHKPPVLPSKPPPNGKILAYQKYLE